LERIEEMQGVGITEKTGKEDRGKLRAGEWNGMEWNGEHIVILPIIDLKLTHRPMIVLILDFLQLFFPDLREGMRHTDGRTDNSVQSIM